MGGLVHRRSRSSRSSWQTPRNRLRWAVYIICVGSCCRRVGHGCRDFTSLAASQIIKILVANREKLVAYLEHFHNEKSDEQFR